MQSQAKLCHNMQKFARVCKRMQMYAKVFKGMAKYMKTHKGAYKLKQQLAQKLGTKIYSRFCEKFGAELLRHKWTQRWHTDVL